MESLNLYNQTKEWENACIKTRRNLKKREKRIRKFLIKKTDKVLDLGCGDGLNISILRKLGVKNIIGVDISRDLIRLAKKNNPKIKFFVGSAEKLPFKNSQFDVVFVDSVFHHLLEYDKAIKEIRRVIKKGGDLCFIEPHQSLGRKIFDFITILPVSHFLAFFKQRREAYFGEKHLMTHWLDTEDNFYDILKKNKFVEYFHEYDLLSTIGKYKKV